MLISTTLFGLDSNTDQFTRFFPSYPPLLHGQFNLLLAFEIVYTQCTYYVYKRFYKLENNGSKY